MGYIYNETQLWYAISVYNSEWCLQWGRTIIDHFDYTFYRMTLLNDFKNNTNGGEVCGDNKRLSRVNIKVKMTPRWMQYLMSYNGTVLRWYNELSEKFNSQVLYFPNFFML